jgi:hypothetical protein
MSSFPAKKTSPAEVLNEDGWWSVFQFLTGNDIAKVLGVSRDHRIMGTAAGVWTNSVSTITLPKSELPTHEVEKWRLLGEQMALDSRKLPDDDDSIIFRDAIESIVFNTAISPNLQSLHLLQVPATYSNLWDIVLAVRKSANSDRQLKRLVLELRWFDNLSSWDRRNALLGLLPSLPEEVEFGWIQGKPNVKEIPAHYRDAILKLFSYNRKTLKFTLPGSMWADCGSEHLAATALEENRTVRSLIFKAPLVVSARHFVDHPDGRISCLAKMLVHPSLRHLSIADQIVSDDPLNQDTRCWNYTALYFAASRCFAESTLETLHIELGRETPRGLLAVLHGVADMPQLKRFSLSWPNGGHPTPQQVSMERLREYLKISALRETYKTRPKGAFFGYQKPTEVVLWSTLETLFM